MLNKIETSTSLYPLFSLTAVSNWRISHALLQPHSYHDACLWLLHIRCQEMDFFQWPEWCHLYNFLISPSILNNWPIQMSLWIIVVDRKAGRHLCIITDIVGDLWWYQRYMLNIACCMHETHTNTLSYCISMRINVDKTISWNKKTRMNCTYGIRLSLPPDFTPSLFWT